MDIITADHIHMGVLLGFFDEYMLEAKNFPVNMDRRCLKASLSNMVDNKGVYMGSVNDEVIGAIAGLHTMSPLSLDGVYSSMLLYVKPRLRKYTKEFICSVRDMLNKTSVSLFVVGVPNYGEFEKNKRFMGFMGFKELESHLYVKV